MDWWVKSHVIKHEVLINSLWGRAGQVTEVRELGLGRKREWVGVAALESASPLEGSRRSFAPPGCWHAGLWISDFHVWVFQEKPEVQILVWNLLVLKSRLFKTPCGPNRISESRIWPSGCQLASCLIRMWEDQQDSNGKMSQGHNIPLTPRSTTRNQYEKNCSLAGNHGNVN